MSQKIMSSGDALSTWPISGSHEESNRAIFGDARTAGSLLPVRIQGFLWNGVATLTVKDPNGLVLFNNDAGALYPPTASGSRGLVVNYPLYISTAGPAGGGGTLIVYGEVL